MHSNESQENKKNGCWPDAEESADLRDPPDQSHSEGRKQTTRMEHPSRAPVPTPRAARTSPVPRILRPLLYTHRKMAALASTPLLGLGSRAAIRRRSTASNARRSTLGRSSSGPTVVRPSAAARNDDGGAEVFSGSDAARFAVITLASAAIAMPVAGASQYHSKNDVPPQGSCLLAASSLATGGRSLGKPMSASPPSTPRGDACVAAAMPCGHRLSSESRLSGHCWCLQILFHMLEYF